MERRQHSNFWANVSQPDASLSYSVPGATDNLTGTLGIDGSVSVGGPPSSSAPEPATIGLLAAGLVLVLAKVALSGDGQARRPVLLLLLQLQIHHRLLARIE